MKRFSLILLISILSMQLFAQKSIGIGTSTPNSSAVLDVSSNNKGFLLPLLSSVQRIAIANPAEGLLVYDTTYQRFYQYQGGAWRYIINSDYWLTSTNHNSLYTTSDSVGIGTSIPQQKLDVNGDIRARDNITVASGITAGGGASGETVYATGNLSAAGNMTVVNNMNSSGNLVIDNPSATLQFKTSGVNKTYFQVSGEDMRLGTNSGNNNGNTIIRMNGKNVVQADASSNLVLLRYNGSQELGKMVIGNKVIRPNSNGNTLTVLYGQVFSDGFSPSMWPPSGSSSKISTGVYEIDTNISGVSAKGAIVVTATGSVPRICIGRYYSGEKFRVEIFNLAGNHVDNDFYFMINDPLE